MAVATPPAKRRRWEDLGGDLLVHVFSYLGVVDLCATAFVCSPWRQASKEPSLWRSLDFRLWEFDASPRIDPRYKPHVAFAQLLRFSVGRSRGDVESIWFPDFADEADLLFVAERCPNLCYLYLKNEDVRTTKFLKAIGKLKFLKGISLPEHLITKDVLCSMSLSCANICELRILAEHVDKKMARVVCHHLPSIKKLELNNCRISHLALSYFLDKLEKLEHLDISGYRKVAIKADIHEKASRLEVFNWGWVIDENRISNLLNSDDDSDKESIDMEFMEWFMEDEGIDN